LVAVGDDEPEIHVGGELDLSVILLDGNGDPVEREAVQFEILDEDPGEAALSARRSVTDRNGMATVSLRAGELIREYTVEVWHRETRKLRFQIHVVDMPSGGLEIGIEYNGPVALGRVELYLLEDSHYCEDPYYLIPPEGVAFSGAVENLFDRVQIAPLMAGKRYSAMLRGRLRSNGVLAAGGCVGEILVAEDEVNRVTIQAFLLPLNPGGSYSVDNHFKGAIHSEGSSKQR